MIKEKLYFVLILMIFSGLCFGETIRFDMSFDRDNVIIENYDDYHVISYRDNNAYSFAKEGEPDIPAYMIRVLIPDGSKITGIKANPRNKFKLGSIIPYPFQGYHPVSKPSMEFIPPDKDIYSSGIIFPQERVIMHSTGRSRGFNILYFSFIPFEYDTDNNQLFLYEDVSFELSYEYKEDMNKTQYRGNRVFNEMVMSSVINPYDIAEFYPSKIEPVRKATDYDMLIITTDTFLTASQNYAAYREASAGIISVIKTVSEINTEYTGNTIQLKIKNCIYDYVQNNNITYVFLIGDAGNNSTYSVPDQKVYISYGSYSDNTAPGDIFYSCFDLQFDWNANGNGMVGEINVDNADISPDVIIGRLPVRTAQHITDYMNKVEEYIGASTDVSFIENLLLSGVLLWSHGDAEIKSDIMYEEHIAPYWDFHEKHTLYDSSTTVSAVTLSEKLNEGMNFFHMATHGDVTLYTMGTGGHFYSSHALALNNTPGIAITIACTTNAFDPEVSGASDPCLGEAFIRNPNGGSVVYIGASRYGWGIPNPVESHGPSFQYNNKIFQHTLQNTFDHNIGSAFTQAKIDMVGLANSDGVMRWVHFCLNYLGDPSLTAYKEVEGAVIPPSDFSAEGQSISQINLSWNKNSDNDNVMIIWSDDGVFGIPSDGVIYNIGDTIPGGGTVLYRGSAVSCSHTNLNENTLYYYRAFSYDAGLNYSSGRTASAKTLIAPISNFPWTEDFTANSSYREYWEQEQVQGSHEWAFAVGDGYVINNSQCGNLNARFPSSWTTASGRTKLITPPLDLSGHTSASLSFYYGQAVWSGNQNELKVFYRTSPSGNWTLIEGAHFTGNITQWTQVTLEIPSNVYQIAFEGYNTGGECNVLDCIEIDAEPLDIDLYTVTLSADPSYLSVNLSGGGNYEEGDNVNISAQLAKNYEFVQWTGSYAHLLDNSHSANASFQMPADDVNLTAVFEDMSSPPDAPSGLEANAVSESEIYLSWNDNSNEEEGFKIERKTGQSGSWSQIAETGANTESYTDDGLEAGTVYYYRIRAFNDAGNSSYSNEAYTMTWDMATVYRFFNHIRGGHLYTISENERDAVMDLPEWNYEGEVYRVLNNQAGTALPAYRFFNTMTGIHLYTIYEIERDAIMDLQEWNYEGPTFFVYPEQEDNSIPVYRFFNHVRGGHLYTISEHERDTVMNLPEWNYEGISFYVIPL